MINTENATLLLAILCIVGTALSIAMMIEGRWFRREPAPSLPLYEYFVCDTNPSPLMDALANDFLNNAGREGWKLIAMTDDQAIFIRLLIPEPERNSIIIRFKDKPIYEDEWNGKREARDH